MNNFIKKLDFFGIFFLINILIGSVLFFLNEDNLISCWETRNYQVWICEQNLSYFLFYISFLIFLMITLSIIFKLICCNTNQ